MTSNNMIINGTEVVGAGTNSSLLVAVLMTIPRLRSIWRTIAICLLLRAFVMPVAARTSNPEILIIYPYRGDSIPYVTIASAFKTALSRNLGRSINFHETNLDLERFRELPMQSALLELLQKRFATHRPDLIVPIGAPAAEFVMKHARAVFPETPVLLLSADRRIMDSEPPDSNATVINQHVTVSDWVKDVLGMAPDTTGIVMVTGATSVEKKWLQVIRSEMLPFKDRLNLTFLTGMSLDQIEKRVAALPAHSFIIVGMLVQDSAGITYAGNEFLKRLHAVANAPIYGIYQSEMGMGIIGGRLFQDETMGIRAADSAARILRGEPAESIPDELLPLPSPVYDWRELKRWGIKESRLPAGGSVLFREPTIWQRYRWHIAGIALFCLIETLLILGLLINLRRRHRAEQSLRQGEERFRQVAETVSDFVWEVDANGLYTYTGPSVEKILGYTPDELVGKIHFYDLFVPEDREHLKAEALAVFGARKSFRRFHNDNVSKSGRRVNLETSGLPILDETGRLLGYRGADTDVTHRRRSEMETQLLRQELALFSRVGTMNELTASIAHELNQPLAAILNNAQAALRLMQCEAPDLKELREIFHDVVADDQRAADVIRSMRTMLKRGVGERHLLSINDLITNIMPLVRNEALIKRISVVLDLGSPMPPVEGDRIQLQQVILNLIVNAFEAMEASEQPRQLVLRTQKVDGEIVLDVRDSGSGIPADKFKSIFEPFFTTKAAGLGMGLSLCHTIVTAHKGRIWAENNPERGAAFHIALPI